METLRMEKWKEKGYLDSEMDQYMMVSTKIIGSMDLESIARMEKCSKVSGTME